MENSTAMLLKFLEEQTKDRKAFYSKYFLSMQCRRQLQLCWTCSTQGTMIYGKHLSVPYLRILKKLCFSYDMNKLTIHSTIKLCNIHNIWETKNIKNVVTLSNKKSVCYFASRLSRVVSLVKLDSLTNLPLAGINSVWHYFKVILTPCVDSTSKLQHLHTYVICCHSFIRDIYTLIN